MTIVFAYHATNRSKDEELRTRVVGKKAASYDKLFQLLKEGDSATVEVPGKGFKTISIEKGQRWVQRNFAPEY